jgi:lipopolysaccharide biosynthesis glycosyltransferase
MNNIVFCIDNNFIGLTKFVFSTFCKYHDVKKYKIYLILYDETKTCHIIINKKIMLINSDINVEYIYFDLPLEFNKLHDKISEKYREQSLAVFGNKSNWTRFFISEILKDLDDVLYLDYDILFRGNIDKLFELEFENNMLMAVPYKLNSPPKRRKWKINKLFRSEIDNELSKLAIEKLNLDLEKIKNNNCYNCGVMYLNLKLIREFNITNKIENYFKFYLEHGRFHRHSGTQNINNFYIPQYKHLEGKYNDTRIAISNSIILHFKGISHLRKDTRFLNFFKNIMNS